MNRRGILDAMADAKPRILQDSKDIVWSLIPLLLIALAIAGIAGSCSFGFGKDAAEQKIPDFDSAAAFRADAATLPFPIREPVLPDDWKSNSGSTQPVGDSMASNVGWIVPSGAYLQLTQSGAGEESLVAKLAGDGALGDGVKQIGGSQWVVYRNGENHKKAWIADLGEVRIGVMSRGSDSDMHTLAEAVLKAAPLDVPQVQVVQPGDVQPR